VLPTLLHQRQPNPKKWLSKLDLQARWREREAFLPPSVSGVHPSRQSITVCTLKQITACWQEFFGFTLGTGFGAAQVKLYPAVRTAFTRKSFLRTHCLHTAAEQRLRNLMIKSLAFLTEFCCHRQVEEGTFSSENSTPL